MKAWFLPLAFCFNSVVAQSKSPSFDVCVYGGTSAGVIAAYTAAKMGKKVVLVEPGRHLGGLTSGGLGYTDIGNKYAITGLALDFYRRMGRHYGKFEQWIFEPHVAEQIFDDYVKRAHIVVFFQRRILKAEKQNGFIKKIELESSSSASHKSTLAVVAKLFIDCSYEGDLMASAGVSYTIGRESNETYHETYDGVQLMEGHQFPNGINPYKDPNDPASGLIWGVSTNALEPAGSGDKKVQAYNYRICLSNDPRNMRPILRPAGYDSTKYELLVRLFNAQPSKKTLNDYFFFGQMPDHKTDINNRGGFSTDMIGMNYDYPDGNYKTREAIIRDHENYTKGLLYFVGHDSRVPPELRNEMLNYGYPKDEFTDNDNWSPQLYIRESRRMVGAYVMTQANCEGREVVNDGVGMAAYTMDSHNCERIVFKGMTKNEGNVEIGGFGPYPVSYRSLVPKMSECKNLLVPVCLSASHIAYGSIRMEPVFMVLAQSAAVGGCLAIDGRVPVQQVNVNELQHLLKQNPFLDNRPLEVLADNDDTSSVKIAGKWDTIATGGYGPSYLVTSTSTEQRTVQFRPKITVSANYELHAYLPHVENASDKIHFILFDGKASKDIFTATDINVEGQTSGEWISLGKYRLERGRKISVTVTNAGANGNVVADAILFVPLPPK